MKRISVLFLATLFLLSSTLIFAQQHERLTKSDFGELDRIESLLQPHVLKESTKASQTFQDRLNPSLDVNGYFQLATNIVESDFTSLSARENEVIVTMVLYNALQDIEDEIEIIISELSTHEKVKNELKNDIQHLDMLHDEYQGKEPFARDSIIRVFLWERKQFYSKNFDDKYVDLGRFYSNLLKDDYAEKRTIQTLTEELDMLKEILGGMNEESEVTSLRLQMTMDRRYKFISTLSNMMKKISTTQDSLIQNIK